MTGTSIYERQNQPPALIAARAFRRRYAIARRWRLLRVGVGLALGSLGILVALLWDSSSDYVAAAAAGWLVFGRAILEAQESRERRHGVAAQERFDTYVFGLPWSSSVAGPQPAPEDLRDWGRKQSEDGLRDWYANARPAQHPTDVLLCQRSVITWARQDNTTYAHLLRWAVGVWLVLTLVLGVALDLSLGEYLLRLGIPALPAALDVLEIAKGSSKVAELKARLERDADALLSAAQASAIPPSVAQCRDLQNGIYASRLLPGVPDWMYKLTRDQRQGNMEHAVRSQVDSLPAALR